MADFLLELLSEEIPARMQDKAREDLARLFATELDKAGLKASALETFATPRRLALIARGLPVETAAVSEEIKGPRANAPEQALEGFLRKTGLARDQLVERDGVLFAVIEKPGRSTTEVIAEAVPAMIRAFPWPKSMRWGAASLSTESLRWVRPLQGIVALFDGAVVPFTVAGVTSGNETVGHRFHSSGRIAIGGADSYAATLRAAHVIVDQDERRAIIRDGAIRLAREAGLELIEDEGLVAENAGLTEWPVPLLGRFDPDFLSVPPEVIQLTARVNQKYFVCKGADGTLANAFVCTANIVASDGGAAIVEGNRKVLAARLSDARFFYETDLKVPLEEQAKKLSNIVFHERLGTVADKVDRVARLARWLVEEGIVKGADPAMAERAARLAKADLVTGMVGEFPELQGLMGGYYAAAQGEPAEIAEAIKELYGLNVSGPIGLALGLADRLDTVNSFFTIGEKPTGSRDPFALRRAGLGAMFLILGKSVSLDLSKIVGRDVIEFLIERWKVQNREAGGRPDLIDAVVAVSSGGDLLRLGNRMRALEAFIQADEGVNLLAGYRRAANILKKEGYEAPSVAPGQAGVQAVPPPDADVRGNDDGALPYTPEPAEAALIAALDLAEPHAAAAVEAEDFGAAMAALALLRAPIDAFFQDVTVNDADPAKRAARLALLARIRNAVHRVADFSKIEK